VRWEKPEFCLFAQFTVQFKMRILYYKWLNNHVIVLCPILEEWIIEAAREVRIRIIDFDFAR